MGEIMLNAFLFGYADGDAMLREAADLWWPRSKNKKVEKAKNCPVFSKAGKNIKCLKSQNEYGKIAITKSPNDAISIVFVGPFQNAKRNKKYF